MANFPYYVDFDLNNNQLLKTRWENLSAAPTSANGKVYFDTATKLFRGHNGTNWSNFNNGLSPVESLTGASITINLANGTMPSITLAQNTTLSSISGVPSGVGGVYFYAKITQDTTGGRSFNLPSNVTLTGTINTLANSTSVLQFLSFDGGSNWEAIVLKPQTVPINGTLWTPAQLTTSLWLDAADSSTIAIGSGVSQWSDKSGNNRHATQSTASSQPALINNGLNNLDTIRLDGTNDVLYLPATITDVRFAFVVCKWTTQGTSYKPIFGNPTIPGWDADWQGSGNGTDLFDATFTSTSVLNGEKRINGTVTTGLLSRYTTFTIHSFSTTANVNITNLSADRPHFFGDRFSALEFAEIIVFSAIPSLADIVRLEGYAAHKRGLANLLPSGHLYKGSPPLI